MEWEEMLARSGEGDQQAFGQLVSRYRDMAFGYALSLVDQEQMAEDAVQEALLVAFTDLDHLRNPQAFGAWLRGIVRYQCSRARRTELHTLSWERLEVIGSEEGNPAHSAEVRAVREEVRAAIAQLAPAQREVVLLRYEAGLSQQEIAMQLNLTVAAVNMRLHAARKRLRRRLQMMNDTSTQPHNTGRVQDAQGPVVTIQFAPRAVPPLFSLLTADVKERLCVVQHLTAGRVRAVSTRAGALWTPGQEILDTGQPFTEALPLSTVQHVVDAMSSSTTDAAVLPSGIKTIDVFAPLTQGGSTGVFAEWGVGVLVLLPELLHHLDQEGNRQTFFIFGPSVRDAGHWQEVTREITVGSQNISVVYLPVVDPIAPEFVDGLKNLSSILVLSRRLAEQAIWPCLDPLRCRSQRLQTSEAGSQQAKLTAEIAALLRNYYTLQFSLGEEAQHTLSQVEGQRIQRARKALRFLSQPFFVAEPYTGRPGVFVAASEAVQGFSDILAGRYDTMKAEAFYMVGAAPSQE